MDYVTIARLSADPSWRPGASMEKDASWGMGLAGAKWLGTKVPAVAKAWKGMRGARDLNKATSALNSARNATQSTPWYTKLKQTVNPWAKSPAVSSQTYLANPQLKAMEDAAARARQAHTTAKGESVFTRMGAGAYQTAAKGGLTAAGIATPLAYGRAGTEPLRNERQYAHGYTDAATRAMEELANTPWWKIMGMGLGKAFNKDILWDNLIAPGANRGFMESIQDGWNNGGLRGAFESTAETFGMREMMRKRDMIRNLNQHSQTDPQWLQDSIAEIEYYKNALRKAHEAQNSQP